MTKFIWNEVILNSEEDDYYGYDSYEYDKIFFVGFINNCKSYSINVPIKNLTGNELVGNDRLEKLTLNSGFLSTPVIFTSLGLVKTLEINDRSYGGASVFFEDSALIQIEEIKFKSDCFSVIKRIIKFPQNLNKVTMETSDDFAMKIFDKISSVLKSELIPLLKSRLTPFKELVISNADCI